MNNDTIERRADGLDEDQEMMHNSFIQHGLRHQKLRTTKGQRSVLTTQHHKVDLFGPQLPVSVAESLSYTPGGKTNASVQLNPVSGWAWYIAGRKLLVWQLFKDDGAPRHVVSCRELLLPFSDLAITSNHVSIFVPPDSKTASCIAVTPEGLVRYWEVVSQHAPWTDVNTNLGGEEVCEIHHIPPLGILAVTTSATMILITPTKTRMGMPTVKTQHISSRSWFSGISKEMNSIIFGSSSNVQGTESKIVKVLTKQVGNDWYIYLLAGMKLQFWILKAEKKFENVYEHDLEPMIRKALFYEADQMMPDSSEIEVLISDINLVEGGIMVLAITVKPRSYVLLHFPCEDKSPPSDGFKSCDLTLKDISALEGIPGKVTQLQFLLLPADALFFNRKLIIAVPMGSEQEEGDRLEIPGGKVHGHNIYNNNPIFFSGIYGFVTVSPVDTSSFDLLNRSTVEQTATPRILAAKEPRVFTKPDSVSNIKSAFLLFIRKNLIQCKQIIDKEFPTAHGGLNNPLATTLIKVSLDIINNIPQKDPRWETPGSSAAHSIPQITSLRLESQLAEKQRAHDLFLKFVYELGLDSRLGKVTRLGSTIPTIHLLNEHNEKILAASIIRKLQNAHEQYILEAIRIAVQSMKFTPTTQLTAQDFFYRYVSFADEGIKCLIKRSCEVAIKSVDYVLVYGWVAAANEVVAEIVYAIIERREKDMQSIDRQYFTWLSSSGKNGIYDSLLSLMRLTVELLESTFPEDHEYKRVSYILFRLADILLYLRKHYQSPAEFRKATAIMISCFMKDKLYVLAKQLAYKYKAFHELIVISHLLDGDEVDFSGYIRDFGNEGFCNELFKWYIKNNKKAELLSLEMPLEYQGHKSDFLKKFKKLFWLYNYRSGLYSDGAKELAKSALSYKKDVNAKEKKLSMVKLGLLAAGVEKSQLFDDVNEGLNCITAQKSILDNMITKPVGNVPALTAVEIIEALVSDTNGPSIDYFKEALVLTKLIKNEELKDKILVNIWLKAINLTPWQSVISQEDYENVFFYQLMVAMCSESRTMGLVQPLNKLFDKMDEFSQHCANLKYALHFTYETVYDPIKSS